MSIPLPKRVKDLPPLESDSEDELKTPIKSTSKQNNGENKKFDFLNRPKRVAELSPLTESDDDESRMSRFNHAILDESIILSPLNSPENFTKHQTFDENNRNYLNNSKSTIKDINSIELPDFGKLSLNDEPNKNIVINDVKTLQKSSSTLLTENRINNNSSTLPRLSVFNQIKIRNSNPISIPNTNNIDQISQNRISSHCDIVESNEPKSLIRTNSMPLKNSQVLTSTVFRSKSESINNNNSCNSNNSNNNNSNNSQTSSTSSNHILTSIRKNSAEISLNNEDNKNLTKPDDKEKIPTTLSSTSTTNTTVNDETPFKTAISNFVTPLFKSSSSSTNHQLQTNNNKLLKSSSNITSTQKKLKNYNKDEFQSSKVLFRTPYTVSRPIPIVQLPSDSSLSLSFNDDDSIQGTLIPSKTMNKENKELNKNNNNNKENKNMKKFSRDLFSMQMNKIEDIPNDFNDINKNINSDNHHNNDSLLKDNHNQNDDDGADDVDENDKNKKIIVINGKEYILDKKLGSGGSSSVYLAKNKITKHLCAIKIVDLKGDKAIVEGYLNETKLLAKLQGNVNIVALYEYEHIPDKSTLYMVMEKGDSDLHKILQTYKTDIPLYILVNFWYQILQAVNYIHENGVIHSDLKPSNFLMINGRLKLIDFGIASNISVDSTSIIKYSQAGTFNYISPEALIDTSTENSPITNKGQPRIKISTKSDVWSLGCILYLLLYKKTPFGHIKNIYAKVNAITSSETKINYPEIPSFYPNILIEMAQKCLKHNPKERLSVAELLKYPFDKLIPINNDLSNRIIYDRR